MGKNILGIIAAVLSGIAAFAVAMSDVDSKSE